MTEKESKDLLLYKIVIDDLVDFWGATLGFVSEVKTTSSDEEVFIWFPGSINIRQIDLIPLTRNLDTYITEHFKNEHISERFHSFH